MSIRKHGFCNLFSQGDMDTRLLLPRTARFPNRSEKSHLQEEYFGCILGVNLSTLQLMESTTFQNWWRAQNNPQKGEVEMGHAGKKDKGQKEQKKKSKHTLKEKRKLKQEKHQQTEQKHLVIPGWTEP